MVFTVVCLLQLKQVLSSMGHRFSDSQYETMFSRSDLNGDGMIKYDEFMGMMKNQAGR